MAIQNLNTQEVTQVSGGLLGALNIGGLLGTVTGLLFGTPAANGAQAQPGLIATVLGVVTGLLGSLGSLSI